MEIKTAVFHSSSGRLNQLPQENLPEFAFVGRSNVGKSSLINMLCNRKALAHTSSTPGKTQSINLYLINETWYLCDLPGFGYAKVAKTQRSTFQKMILNYVTERNQLDHIFVLVDGRIEAQKIDLEFVEFLISENKSYSIIVTKTDKGRQKEIALMLNEFKKLTISLDSTPPEYFLTSSISKKGQTEVLAKISALIAEKKQK
jgi:GTP-binding protein